MSVLQNMRLCTQAVLSCLVAASLLNSQTNTWGGWKGRDTVVLDRQAFFLVKCIPGQGVGSWAQRHSLKSNYLPNCKNAVFWALAVYQVSLSLQASLI